MKKAASIFLRAQIEPEDIDLLMQWMANPSVTRYLNEDPEILRALEQTRATVSAPMLTYYFNRQGRFFLVCPEESDAIGFVKLREAAQPDVYEIVYAIGEEQLWGRGYGKGAINSALAKVFFDLRGKAVVAKICPDNHRSIRSVRSCGFQPAGSEGLLTLHRITMGEYFSQLRKRSSRSEEEA